MTTFTQLYDLIVDYTKRPELITLTKAALKAATVRAHTSGFFYRDAMSNSQSLVLDPSKVWIDIPNVYSLINNLRAIQCVQMLQESNDFPLQTLEYVDRQDIWRPNSNSLKTGVYTLEGSTLRLYPNFLTNRIKIEGFVLPVVTEVGFSSWIANDFAEDLAMWAASIVHARTGALELARANLEANVRPFKEMLAETYTVPTVY